MTQRTDAGAWTDYDNGTDGYRIARMFVLVNGFDDGTGSGGGGVPIIGGSIVRAA